MIVTIFGDSVYSTVEVPNEIPELLPEEYEEKITVLLNRWSDRYKEEWTRYKEGQPYDKLVCDPERTPGQCFARYLGMNRIPAREVRNIGFWVREGKGIWEDDASEISNGTGTA